MPNDYFLYSANLFVLSLIPTNVHFIMSYLIHAYVHLPQASSEHVTADAVAIYPT
jgi:hypothetical protein